MPQTISRTEAEPLLDTSRMSAEKRTALKISEGASDRNGNDGLAAQLFHGRFAHELIDAFPVQTPEDKAVGDDLCERVGVLLRTHLDPEAVDASRTIPAAVITGLAAMGIFRMRVPKDYGGLGLSQVNYNRVMMRIASWCGSTAVLVSAHQSSGLPQPLQLFGTPLQKERWFPRISAGSLSAFALSEPGVGSDPSQMATTARLSEDGRHFILAGEKLWCTNGAIADLIVVMARTSPKVINGVERPQLTALVVEKAMAGVEVLRRCDFMGLRAIHNGVIRFHDVRVPVENVLWGVGRGLKLALTTLNTGRLTLTAATTGMAKQCLSFCRRWGAERVQRGLPIGAHEFGRHKLAWIASHTLAMEAVTWLTSHWADQGRDLRLEAAMAKLFTSETAWRIVDMTMQMRGARGYEKAASLQARGEESYPVERMMRDCRSTLIVEGTSEITRLFIAREAMDPHLRLAGELQHPGGKMRAGARLASHYSAWYPQQWLNSSLWHHHNHMGELAGHYHYIEAGAHRLARTIFHQMGLHRDRLERRQLVLGRLMDIGTDLFAMAATCSYARHLGSEAATRLADHFCREAVRRIEAHYRELAANHDPFTNEIGRAVLRGDMRWLEEGVEWIGKRE
jgi:alkylation response protein AidB-like acyl-CoA dehydrogenase